MTERRSLMMPAAVGAVLLTMTALGQVFREQRWFVPSLFAVALSFGTGWVARRLDVPAFLAPALSVLAMLTLLGIVFVPETTMAGVPTGATMQAIGDLLRGAGSDIKQLAPPAEPTEALTLLATAGVFLVATLVDVFVFWLRRPVAAGMPLLTLFLIPTAMADHTNVFAFVLGAAGFLGILVAEGRDRARGWGRRLSGLDIADEVADVSHVARVGRRIGSAAVGIALCVPLALPSVGDGIFDGTGVGSGIFGNGKGNQTAYVINPIVEIRTQLQSKDQFDLLSVDTLEPQYLRITTLDVFTGEEWTIVNRTTGSDHRVGDGDDENVPTPEELEDVPLDPVEYDVNVGPLAMSWLPLAYVPERVYVEDGDWRYEDLNHSVFSTNKKSNNLSYRARSLVPTPSIDQMKQPGSLPRHIRDVYLQLPPGDAPRTAIEVLERETAGKETAYDRAVALNEYFFRTGGFRYSLDVQGGTGANAVDSFLTRKTGYCEQFAAAMAYLARLSGIPARVVVGFTPGSRREGDRWYITNRDAHAWPELYFPHAGWVRFEPTPLSGFAPPDYARPPAPAGALPEPSAAPTAPPADGAAAEPSGRPRALDEAAENLADPESATPPGVTAEDGGVPVLPLAGLVTLVGLATPSTVGWATRRRRLRRTDDPLDRIHAAWDSLADAAEDTGHALRAADSPRGAARRLVAGAALTGTAAAEVERLAAAEERARYARSAPPVDGLDASARLVRKTLLDGLSKRARARALVFPPSALRRIGDAVRAANDTVDRRRSAVRARMLGALRRRTRAA